MLVSAQYILNVDFMAKKPKKMHKIFWLEILDTYGFLIKFGS